jgi:hypothetical protein
MMTDVTEYRVELSAAKRFASLNGAKADMESVMAYTSRMIERWCGPHLKKTPFDIVGFSLPVDLVEWEALSTATAIAYARCFGSGVRTSLPADDTTLVDPNFRTLHSFLIEFRNKHVAHSVNSFEENIVSVHITQDFTASAEIESITSRHTRQTGFNFDLPERIQRLAKWWLDWIVAQMDNERAQLLCLLRTLDLAEIKNWARASEPAQPRNVSAKRKSF